MVTTTATTRKRLALAEDHTIVRWALREALSAAEDFEVVGEAGTAAETLAMVDEVTPELLLLDLTFPDRSGLDVLDDLSGRENPPLVIVLTWHMEAGFARRAIAAGARAYVNKSISPQDLFGVLRRVAAGERVVPDDVELPDANSPIAALTTREQQVMEMLARGLTNREIAEHFSISIKTVDTHRGHILKKLDLKNNSDLTRFAVKHGYVLP